MIVASVVVDLDDGGGAVFQVKYLYPIVETNHQRARLLEH
jgi:hypothetical protein